MKNSFIFLLAAFLLSSCAFGPLVVQETARSIPESGHELSGGFGQAGLHLKWSYGLTDKWDLGFQYEPLTISARAKYSFVNNLEAGWSLATAFGLGSSAFGSHKHLDIMGSYLKGQWEPFTNLRLVHGVTDEGEIRDDETGDLFLSYDESEIFYGQLTFGSRYWFKQHFFMSLEGTALFIPESTDAYLFQAGLGWRI